jgi:phenylalanyl-tRNA synthetase alpha chain
MTADIESLLDQARADIEAAADARALEQLRVDLLGKKGRVTELLKQLGGMEPGQRKAFGERVNHAKDAVAALLDARKRALADAGMARQLGAETIDVTLPGRGEAAGGLHPLTRTLQRIERLFAEQGFASV